jgi:Membrane proteins related to metalloendopeptidases
MIVIKKSEFIKPLEHGQITENYSYRGYICKNCSSFHRGIDIASPEGTYVYASASGVVADVKLKQSCGGNIITINHKINENEYITIYKHLLTVEVSKGDYVEQGQQIGTVGGGEKTKSYDKCSTGSHLHFEIGYGKYIHTDISNMYIPNLFNPRNKINLPVYGGRF